MLIFNMVRLFKKESEIIDYTDRGKNIPEIRLDYGVTKDGFIEFKNKPDLNDTHNLPSKSNESTSAFDFLNNIASANSNSSSNNTSLSSPFDFLDNPANININNNNELSAGSSDQILELKKIIEGLSFQSEQNSSETYQLMQRIQLLERKMGRLVKKE